MPLSTWSEHRLSTCIILFSNRPAKPRCNLAKDCVDQFHGFKVAVKNVPLDIVSTDGQTSIARTF